MPFPNAAARRVLVLCKLIPLPEMTQHDVDFLFQRLVEDAPFAGEADDPPCTPAERYACG